MYTYIGWPKQATGTVTDNKKAHFYHFALHIWVFLLNDDWVNIRVYNNYLLWAVTPFDVVTISRNKKSDFFFFFYISLQIETRTVIWCVKR